MKIDRVIFSTSERFSVYWNLQAQIWKRHLGIEPICLLLGDRSKTDMSEEFGKVIEVPINPNYPHLIQITWSKFYWPILEPDATTLVGDIDLFPLAPGWFKDRLAAIPENNYVHLDADGITQLNGTQYTWANKHLHAGNLVDFGCPTNMPGHYHCAKGSTFRTGLEQERGSFDAEIAHIVESGLYRNTRGLRDSDPIEQHNLWCAEELRSTKAIRRSIIANKIQFTGLHLRHGLDRLDGDRLDKSTYLFGESRYRYDPERLAAGLYADLHCVRPFDHVAEDERERRWSATENLLRTAWNDTTLKR